MECMEWDTFFVNEVQKSVEEQQRNYVNLKMKLENKR